MVQITIWFVGKLGKLSISTGPYSIISYVELAEGSILLVDPAMKNPKSTLWLCQQFAIEHGHRYSVGFPSENGDFP